MSNDQEIEKIVYHIIHSKKYKAVYEGTVRRIVTDCFTKYGKKQAEINARNLLHQIWGAYYPTRPNFTKILHKFEEDNTAGIGCNELFLSLLDLQTSTKERKPILSELYSKIFSITGTPHSIVDLGCGLNPLTFNWMGLSEQTKYMALDIDKEQMQFLSEVFSFLKMQNNKEFILGDIFEHRREYADIVFLFKILPLINLQQKASILSLLDTQNCRYIVVSFPTKSIGGKEKGMVTFYAQQFENILLEKIVTVDKLLFETELVYILKNKYS